MQKECTLTIPPKWVNQEAKLRQLAASQLGVSPDRISHLSVVRRSIDSRKSTPKYVLRTKVYVDEVFSPDSPLDYHLQEVKNRQEVMIVGLGPAGLFAALHLIHLGFKPIVIERGKAVRERRRDLANLTKEGVVNPESNYCFGEGGAGTFSDGKLYTRSTKRGDTRMILDLLVKFGATPEILIDAHPHIGTNKLPKIIQQMREEILAHGGEILFDTRLSDLRITSGKLSHVQVNDQEWLPVDALILATGHSARDIFHLLHQHKIAIEAKPFALGVRVEHPQALIDEIQYHTRGPRNEHLPAASYALTRQVQGKGVYSFCMCPGGIICPAATQNDEVVVNGWSPSKRNSPYANSGMVVQLTPEDLKLSPDEPLAGVAFQQKIEQRAFQAGGGKQVAPAQRLIDFVNGKSSSTLPDCSYLPGITPANLKTVLPKDVHLRLKSAFKAFGYKMRGYLSQEAVVVGVESRTSSPVRIPRNRESLMHPEVAGFFPCGEGAGYAGGIMSAAIDGQKCATAVSQFLGVSV